MPNFSSSNSISIGGFANVIGTSVDQTETDLQNALSQLGPEPTQKDMLLMQQKLQSWSMLVQLDSTIVKEIGDTLKGIIQKAA
ncbi:EscF/YscF/HrpA family type III secretion system needle major subunit [Paraburkholderia agricolaris]|uniref:EscF/YscF/HrpA family type III secretion system needle major subunit n=1 Tax=Paraburkholderia TaxID=1822464 RepID=UPI001290D059|nr:EscF/YscF/HrpA family type III secretion system needle major subunit [Paraburkholderia agricolaris]